MLLIAVASSTPWIDAILPSFLVAASLTDASRPRAGRGRGPKTSHAREIRDIHSTPLAVVFLLFLPLLLFTLLSNTDGRTDERTDADGPPTTATVRPAASVVVSCNDFPPFSPSRLLHKRTHFPASERQGRRRWFVSQFVPRYFVSSLEPDAEEEKEEEEEQTLKTSFLSISPATAAHWWRAAACLPAVSLCFCRDETDGVPDCPRREQTSTERWTT